MRLILFLSFFFLFIFSSCEKIPTESESGTDSYWKNSTPEEQGVDGNILNLYYSDVRIGKYGEIHSLLIIRHGYLIKEEYFRGYSASSQHQVYSVTKSITSCLIGIAFDQGKLQDIKKRLLSFFPEYPNIAYNDNNKALITLEDVLAMRAGFDWNESYYPYDDQRNPVFMLSQSADWIKYMLDTRMALQPGTRFVYNSGCSILLGGILRNVLGIQTHDFARTYLFGPLNITNYVWDTGPQNLTNTGWGLHMLPRDMAKIGFLYLKNGKWEDRQILSKDWVQKSTSHISFLTQGFTYGYQWWQRPLSKDSLTNFVNDIKIAWGYGGQYIFVIPSLDMVVISTAGDFNQEYEGAINLIQDMLNNSVKRF